MRKGDKLIIIRDCNDEDLKYRIAHNTRELKFGEIVEFIKSFNNFYGFYYRVKTKEDIVYDLNPDNVKLYEKAPIRKLYYLEYKAMNDEYIIKITNELEYGNILGMPFFSFCPIYLIENSNIPNITKIKLLKIAEELIKDVS